MQPNEARSFSYLLSPGNPFSGGGRPDFDFCHSVGAKFWAKISFRGPKLPSWSGGRPAGGGRFCSICRWHSTVEPTIRKPKHPESKRPCFRKPFRRRLKWWRHNKGDTMTPFPPGRSGKFEGCLFAFVYSKKSCGRPHGFHGNKFGAIT